MGSQVWIVRTFKVFSDHKSSYGRSSCKRFELHLYASFHSHPHLRWLYSCLLLPRTKFWNCFRLVLCSSLRFLFMWCSQLSWINTYLRLPNNPSRSLQKGVPDDPEYLSHCFLYFQWHLCLWL